MRPMSSNIRRVVLSKTPCMGSCRENRFQVSGRRNYETGLCEDLPALGTMLPFAGWSDQLERS